VCSSMTVIRTAMIQVWCLSVGVYGQVREGVCWCVGACGCVCAGVCERGAREVYRRYSRCYDYVVVVECGCVLVRLTWPIYTCDMTRSYV